MLRRLGEQGQLPCTYFLNCRYLMKSSTEPVDLSSGGASIPPEILMPPVVSPWWSTVHVGILPSSSCCWAINHGGDRGVAVREQGTWDHLCALCPVGSWVRKAISVKSDEVLGGPQACHNSDAFEELYGGWDKAPGPWALLTLHTHLCL